MFRRKSEARCDQFVIGKLSQASVELQKFSFALGSVSRNGGGGVWGPGVVSESESTLEKISEKILRFRGRLNLNRDQDSELAASAQRPKSSLRTPPGQGTKAGRQRAEELERGSTTLEGP